MTLTFGFYNSVEGDRTYDAVQMSNIVSGIIADGIFAGIGTSMKVTNPSALNVNIGIGRAWFNNTWTLNDAVLGLTLDAADALLPRIDAIILEIDANIAVRENSIKIIKGTPATIPVNPTLIHTSLKNQYALAYCRINAASSTINILTDVVGTAETPYIASAIDTNLPKATIGEIQAGSDVNKYVSPKNLKDSLNYPNVPPAGLLGYKIVGNGTGWVAGLDDGWIPDPNTWTYSSIDSPTGVFSVNANMTGKIQNGMRLKYTQAQPLTCYCPMDSSSAPTVGAFSMTDTAMSYTAGKFGNAATFNGTTSKIVITDNLNFKPSGISFTFGFWMKAATPGATQYLFQSASINTNHAGIFIRLMTTGKINVLLGDNTGTTIQINYTTFDSKTTVGDNNWHYVVLTWRNNYAQLYVDGQLEFADYSLGPSYAGTNYVRLGCLNTAGGADSNFFSGQIDDFFSIYGYALDQETIMSKFISNSAQGTGNISLAKKAIVTNVGAFTGGNTLITAFHGTDFDITNAAITNPHYSSVKSPFGFNVNPEKWRIFYARYRSGMTKATIVVGNWYGNTDFAVPGPSITIPIGIWNLEYSTYFQMISPNVAGYVGFNFSMSTNPNSESHPYLTTSHQLYNHTNTAVTYQETIRLSYRNLVLTSKSTFYMVFALVNGALNQIGFIQAPPSLFALTCAYL